jgi:hypothetical protein
MEEEFDWGWADKSKEEILKEFEEKFRNLDNRYIERIVEWYGFVVYDIDKASPFNEEIQKLIREYCDCAYYTDDLGTGIKELDLPRYKASIQAEIDFREARRTAEEKKASEALVRERLKKVLEKIENEDN